MPIQPAYPFGVYAKPVQSSAASVSSISYKDHVKGILVPGVNDIKLPVVG